MASKCVVCHAKSEGQSIIPGMAVCNECKAKPSHVAMASSMRAEIETYAQERYGREAWFLARWLGPVALVLMGVIVILRVWLQYSSGPGPLLLSIFSSLSIPLLAALAGYYAYGKLASNAADALGIAGRPPLLQSEAPAAGEYHQA